MAAGSSVACSTLLVAWAPEWTVAAAHEGAGCQRRWTCWSASGWAMRCCLRACWTQYCWPGTGAPHHFKLGYPPAALYGSGKSAVRGSRRCSTLSPQEGPGSGPAKLRARPSLHHPWQPLPAAQQQQPRRSLTGAVKAQVAQARRRHPARQGHPAPGGSQPGCPGPGLLGQSVWPGHEPHQARLGSATRWWHGPAWRSAGAWHGSKQVQLCGTLRPQLGCSLAAAAWHLQHRMR